MSLRLLRPLRLHRWPVLLGLLFTLLSSGAQASDNCFDLVNSFIDSPQARTLARSDSFVQRHPEIEPILERMIPPSIDFPAYIREFQQQAARTPTLREAIEHVYESRREIHASYDELIEKLYSYPSEEALDFIKEVELSRLKLSKFKDLDAMELEVMQNFINGKSSVESLDIPIPTRDHHGQTFFDEDYYRLLKDRTGLSNYSGEVGELLVYARTPEQILAKGLRFDVAAADVQTPYQAEIMQRISLLRENLLTKDVAELKAIIDTYTTPRGGFLRHADEFIQSLQDRPLVASEIVDKIMNMVTSKEIDLVSLSGDRKIVWTEVKAYNHKLNLESINGDSTKKSIVDQLLEHKALRDLLGLEHLVELRFSSPLAGIDDEAKALIETLGFKVF